MRRTQLGVVGALAAAALTLPTTAVAAPSPAPDPSGLSPAQRTAVEAGFQLAPKAGSGAKAAAASANPYLANLPDLTSADYTGWKARLQAQGRARASSAGLAQARRQAAPRAARAAVVHDEEEPAGTSGSNDTAANAERISTFGTLPGRNNRLRILGGLADLGSPDPEVLAPATEDNGAIPLATDTGIEGDGSVTTESTLGDGPHGRVTGDGSNDFDFYSLEVDAGRSIVASTEGSDAGLDTILAVYDADGEIVAADDDGGTGLLSVLDYAPPTPGTYYVLVAGYSPLGPVPEDPFDSGSGAGGADEGDYALALSAQQIDTDYFAVRLRPGDVVGGVADGSADGLSITKPDGTRMVGAEGLDATSLYPPTSPLPGGGNTTLAYVAEEAGWYAVGATGSTGSYDLTVEGYRPGTETDTAARRQTVLLDFAPGRVNTGTWGGPGVRRVSPFSAFVPQWGIPASAAATLETRITTVVRDNIQREIQARGLNPAVDVTVLNARGHSDLIGKENVSRIYVAGTIAQTGLETIGIAQYIDPGNYGHQDEAIVLLDVLSEPAGPISSLNTFMNASSDRQRFVAQAVGNVTAHEIGHTIGSYHTDFANDVHNIMDSGGGFFAENLYGVGPDGIGGTPDDENGRFKTDEYSPAEGFTGLENTLNVTAWAYSGR